LKDIEILAKNFIKKLKNGSIVCLKGELGAGKTTFARFLINCFYDLKKIKKPASIKSP
jgi:tRNA A37 threonylcarbamoyladenosine biosynthesis protein TsaE